MTLIYILQDRLQNLTITLFVVAMLVVSIVVYRKAGPRRNLLHYVFLVCTCTATFYVTVRWITDMPSIIDTFRMYGL